MLNSMSGPLLESSHSFNCLPPPPKDSRVRSLRTPRPIQPWWQSLPRTLTLTLTLTLASTHSLSSLGSERRHNQSSRQEQVDDFPTFDLP